VEKEETTRAARGQSPSGGAWKPPHSELYTIKILQQDFLLLRVVAYWHGSKNSSQKAIRSTASGRAHKQDLLRLRAAIEI